MAHGKNIRIYLADGSVSGIRHAEVVNWTGQAVACARSRIGELKDWEEAKRPGVYFLFGVEDGTNQSRAYVGEGEVVLSRVLDHVRSKEFWNEVVLFTSKDELLTKAHVKFLESRLIALATEAGRYTLENEKESGVSRLPRGDMDAMAEYIDHLRVLLGALGHRILEPMTTPVTKQQTVTDGKMLHLAARDAKARMQIAEDGFVVVKGSTAVREHVESLAPNYVQLRERLIAERVLVPSGTVLEFSRDHLFAASTAAASVVCGSNRNGREIWKDDSGRTIRELEEAALDASGATAAAKD